MLKNKPDDTDGLFPPKKVDKTTRVLNYPGLEYFWKKLKQEGLGGIRSINGISPDEDGNLYLDIETFSDEIQNTLQLMADTFASEADLLSRYYIGEDGHFHAIHGEHVIHSEDDMSELEITEIAELDALNEDLSPDRIELFVDERGHLMGRTSDRARLLGTSMNPETSHLFIETDSGMITKLWENSNPNQMIPSNGIIRMFLKDSIRNYDLIMIECKNRYDRNTLGAPYILNPADIEDRVLSPGTTITDGNTQSFAISSSYVDGGLWVSLRTFWIVYNPNTGRHNMATSATDGRSNKSDGTGNQVNRGSTIPVSVYGIRL